MELGLFVRIIGCYEYICENIDTGVASRLKKNDDRCAINVKKFSGLLLTANEGASRIICVDSDTIAISQPDCLMDACENNSLKRVFLGSIPKPSSTIYFKLLCEIQIASCLLVSTKFNYYTDDAPGVYSWFFDVPYYPGDLLREFFVNMTSGDGALSHFFMSLSWFTFDHLIFQHWMVATGRAKFIDYGQTCEALPEWLTPSDLVLLKEKYDYVPAWIPLSAYRSDPLTVNKLQGEVILAYHTDRAPPV